MPAIVGPASINDISGGVVNFGDVFYISPNDAGKTTAGSGAFNTGDFLVTNNGVSTTNSSDGDVVDQATVGNL